MMRTSIRSGWVLAVALVLAPALLTARTKVVESQGLLEYHEVLTGGATADEKLPMIVAIHGLGDEPVSFGTGFRTLPFKARVILPRAPSPHGSGFSWYVSHRHTKDPKLRLDTIRDSSARLERLMRHLAGARSTVGKPLVTGFSQGGLMSFVIAARYPDLVAKAVPVAGDLPTEFLPGKASAGKALPVIRALHGGKDPVFQATDTAERIEALKRIGYDAGILVFPDVGHSVPPAMRKEWHRLLGTSGD